VTTALYRRYRPESFAEVIGQDHVTAPLRQALRSGQTNHAYLFSGPRGCGKTTSARILARCLNCAQGPTDTPCGVCPSCLELARGGPGSLDVVEIDAASHGGVDDARELRERATFAPARDRYKVFILDEAHMVSPQGFNALLKIVEEPPPHVKFIFATTEPDKVIGTIRSRTHHYPFRLVPPDVLVPYLEQLCSTEGVPVGAGVLSLVVRAGGGSVRDTLSVLDQLIAGAGEGGLEYEGAVALLGYTHASLLDDLVDAIAARDGASAFRVVERVITTGHEPRRFVEDLLERLRDLIVIAASGEAAGAVLRDVPPDQLDRMRRQATHLGMSEVSRSADLANAALTEMVGATSPRLHLELLMARLLLPSVDDSRTGLGARLDRLERGLPAGGGQAVPASAAGGVPGAGPRAADDGDAGGAPRRGAAEGVPGQEGAPAVAPTAARSTSPASTVPPGTTSQGTTSSDTTFPGTASPGTTSSGTVPSGTTPSGTVPSDPAGPDHVAPGAVAARTSPGKPPVGDTAREDVAPGHAGHRAQSGTSTGEGSAPGSGPGAGVAPAGHDTSGRPAAAPSATPPAVPPAAAGSGSTSSADPAPPSAARPPAVAGAPTPVASAATAAAGAAPGAVAAAADTEMLRRRWPDVLTTLRRLRLPSWALVNQHAQILELDATTLRLGFAQPGLVSTFRNSNHGDVVARALSETLGVTARVEAVLDDPGGASAPAASRPAADVPQVPGAISPERAAASWDVPAPAAPRDTAAREIEPGPGPGPRAAGPAAAGPGRSGAGSPGEGTTGAGTAHQDRRYAQVGSGDGPPPAADPTTPDRPGGGSATGGRRPSGVGTHSDRSDSGRSGSGRSGSDGTGSDGTDPGGTGRTGTDRADGGRPGAGRSAPGDATTPAGDGPGARPVPPWEPEPGDDGPGGADRAGRPTPDRSGPAAAPAADGGAGHAPAVGHPDDDIPPGDEPDDPWRDGPPPARQVTGATAPSARASGAVRPVGAAAAPPARPAAAPVGATARERGIAAARAAAAQSRERLQEPDEPSPDDPTIGQSGLVGVPLVAQVLGGRVIDEQIDL